MMNMFKETHRDPGSQARAGVLKTAHGQIQTPCFMPVGTQATVKTVSSHDLKDLGAQIMLSNTYHLYLRPGADLIEKVGGLHEFMQWDRPILTDSGGYQIFSIGENQKLDDKGWHFKSHLDGSSHFLSPEDVVRIQQQLGSDILMPLDECVPYPCDKKTAAGAVERTQLWLKRSQEAWQKDPKGKLLFGIVQGSIYKDLRQEALERVESLGLPGMAIGGLSVGEGQELMVEILDELSPFFPQNKPRYLMGVGYPEDLVLAVERGVDMFDCVAPTRNGRNGTVFTSEGKLLIRNKEFEADMRPLDKLFPQKPDLNFSRAYLRHLFMAHEMLGLRLASLWNLTYFVNLLDAMRHAIQLGRFSDFKKDFFRQRETPCASTMPS